MYKILFNNSNYKFILFLILLKLEKGKNYELKSIIIYEGN